jgi:hypothetical protein
LTNTKEIKSGWMAIFIHLRDLFFISRTTSKNLLLEDFIVYSSRLTLESFPL